MQRILFLPVALTMLILLPGVALRASQTASAPEMRRELLTKANQRLSTARTAHPAGKTKAQKRLDRLGKRLAKLTNNTGEIDFTDPVEKWLWFGLIGLGAALVLTILFPFPVAGVVGFLAVVCLVIWLLKRSGAA